MTRSNTSSSTPLSGSGHNSPSRNRSLTPKPRIRNITTAQHAINSGHNNTPGIIHLPSPQHQSTTSSAPSTTSTRHSAPKSRKKGNNRGTVSTEQTQPNTNTGTILSELSLSGLSLSSGTQSTRHAENDDNEDDGREFTTKPVLTSPDNTEKLSPTKGRRSKQKANRQTSPPLPAAAQTEQQTHHSYRHYPVEFSQQSSSSSSADEWDMPVATPGRTVPVANLTWQQQEGLSRSASMGQVRADKARRSKKGTVGSNTVVTDGKNTSAGRARSGSLRHVASNPSTGSQASPHKQRPPLNGFHSDSAATTTGLTWQQELLQSSGGERSISPQKSHTASGKGPSRRQQQRDEQTFGIGSLDLTSGESASEDLFGALEPERTPRRSKNQQQQKQQKHSGDISARHQQYATPTKVSMPAEERYAGPTFHNSPLPSSLPTPSFLLRRKALEVSGH